ncbi:hypothetical protein BpHYR1_017603 [Brachionus plicatilis]|uniref:Uncharacterized protein n=1 Tax=Brachionus plicatilis TaxID=10195 RepID=A0A3M7T9I8_BRAPC|nr:hypothetical protein BpHYR1_017603 [Brachionus plicatilis]
MIIGVKFLCIFTVCNFTPLMFFINSPHKSHGTGFACLLSAVFTSFKQLLDISCKNLKFIKQPLR